MGTSFPPLAGFELLCALPIPPHPLHSYTTRTLQAFAEVREQNSMEAVLLPCIGGLTTGVLALGYPEILYQARLGGVGRAVGQVGGIVGPARRVGWGPGQVGGVGRVALDAVQCSATMATLLPTMHLG